MIPINNELINIFDYILEKSNGKINKYCFYCSTFFDNGIKEYKGIKIFYSELIDKNDVYYSEEITINKLTY
jgi:hypothetical protein